MQPPPAIAAIRAGLARRLQPYPTLRRMALPLLLCTLLAVISLGQPIDDLLHDVRDTLHPHAADPSIVVAAIDDKTIAALGTSEFSRDVDAALVDGLFAAGAKRVVLDRAYTRPAPGTTALAAALARHRGRVFLTVTGRHVEAASVRSSANTLQIALMPLPELHRNAGIAALNGLTGPLNLVHMLPISVDIGGRAIPSVSSLLAGRPLGQAGDTNRLYRPDSAIQITTIPTISAIDILQHRALSRVAGSNVIVAPVNTETNDYHNIMGQGWVPGVYLHVIGAQTLKAGLPIDLQFWPALLIAAIFAFALFRLRSQRLGMALATGGFIVLLIALPFAADAARLEVQLVPSIALLAIATYESTMLRAARRNRRTELPNLAAMIEDHGRSEAMVIAMRLRNYPAIRATYGEATAAAAIRELVRRLQSVSVPTRIYQADDTLYWLMPYLPHWQLNNHLEGLTMILEAQISVEGQRIDPQFTFGVEPNASRPIDERASGALHAADLAAADETLWHSQSEESQEALRQQLALMGDLDRALQDGTLEVAYQPQVDTRTGTISGIEALARWNHPELGPIAPDVFIAAAEAHHRIRRLTKYIIARVLRETAPCLAMLPELRIAVNLSGLLLETPDFIKEIKMQLDEVNFPCRNFTIEITETKRFAGHMSVIQALRQIAESGVRISIDDYGTGNATLEYVKIAPVHEVKIDRRFISAISKDEDNQVMVSSTIAMAHNLGLQVVAEGIEDIATAEWLTHRHCDALQGFFYSRPLPIAELMTMIMRPKGRWGAANHAHG